MLFGSWSKEMCFQSKNHFTFINKKVLFIRMMPNFLAEIQFYVQDEKLYSYNKIYNIQVQKINSLHTM